MRGFTFCAAVLSFLVVFQAMSAGATTLRGQEGGFSPKERVILVTEQKQVWIQCRTAQPNQKLPEGFCERLKTDFATTTGWQVNSQTAIPGAMLGLVVIVDQSHGHRALVTLIAGTGQNGAFIENQRQNLNLGSVDAPLRAGSAQALVFPMVGILPMGL